MASVERDEDPEDPCLRDYSEIRDAKRPRISGPPSSLKDARWLRRLLAAP